MFHGPYIWLRLMLFNIELYFGVVLVKVADFINGNNIKTSGFVLTVLADKEVSVSTETITSSDGGRPTTSIGSGLTVMLTEPRLTSASSSPPVGTTSKQVVKVLIDIIYTSVLPIFPENFQRMINFCNAVNNIKNNTINFHLTRCSDHTKKKSCLFTCSH